MYENLSYYKFQICHFNNYWFLLLEFLHLMVNYVLMFPPDSQRARAHLWSGRRPGRTSDGTIAELAPHVTRHTNVRHTYTSIANYNEAAFARLIT